ncbi:MAG: hypothetical protein COV76_04780 [Candidatus Omnitrophica bacterium CG11_big_fil_rev_8_21_14_0_20_64_10]|nr:MAG: hypothetical protein COV76_04780 [Candidatus Omnitrophica bacterium CG11_big_fil_rev_8_21_14_0_20_64_10]
MPSAPQHGLVLIVEEDREIAQELCTPLRSAGYIPHAEPSGKEALVYLRRYQPHAVVLDRKLPDMNGLQICRHLRSHRDTWTTPVILLAEKRDPAEVLRAYAAGVDATLLRPVDERELIGLIHHLLGAALPL